MTKRQIVSKGGPPVGEVPAIALVNPKYPHNVGAAVRAAASFGLGQVWYSGKRVPLDVDAGERLPREERMRGYDDVTLYNCDYIFDTFPKDIVPVAVEVRDNSEPLTMFEHPKDALYVFGPEDGSLDQVVLRHCHRFVVIPTLHCLNLGAAVNVVLYDRMLKEKEVMF